MERINKFTNIQEKCKRCMMLEEYVSHLFWECPITRDQINKVLKTLLFHNSNVELDNMSFGVVKDTWDTDRRLIWPICRMVIL